MSIKLKKLIRKKPQVLWIKNANERWFAVLTIGSVNYDARWAADRLCQFVWKIGPLKDNKDCRLLPWGKFPHGKVSGEFIHIFD